MDDRFGALCRHTHVVLQGADSGPLVGMSFAVKDVFDIAGHRTGAGNPEWLRTHPPAPRTASAVRKLLDAGAGMIGKTHTDELAYSLNGQNFHYGTPLNPRAVDRIPGGSSSGSAVAVAGGLVDFSLGTDCGGSVRLPASYCGILGFRPTHGRIPLDGAVPLAQSFDTAGWFARDPAILEAVGRVLLADDRPAAVPRRLIRATDMFTLVPEPVTDALADAVQAAAESTGAVEDLAVLHGMSVDCLQVFRILQGAEIWANHGRWVTEAQPTFGPGIRERFEWASTVDNEQVAVAQREREAIAARLDAILEHDAVICLPTAPGIAPLRDAPLEDLEDFRMRAIRLLSLAGLARLPQLSLPLGTLDGCPIGLSVIAPRGADAMLFEIAKRLIR